MMIEEYLNKFSHLRTDKSRSRWSNQTRHRAPHKPLLLLSVIDLFARGLITSNLIESNHDLGEIFSYYWGIVVSTGRLGNIALPFFHLKSEGFWHLLPQPGKEELLDSLPQIRSINYLREVIIGAKLDDELYLLLCSKKSQKVLQTVLIENYFAAEKQAELIDQSTVNYDAYQLSLDLFNQAKGHQVGEGKISDPKKNVRDQGFRRAVVMAYDHRCAFCGIRILTPAGHTSVEAAHIIPWRISHNDTLGNGMALCRLCHWSFDEGLFGVSKRYVLKASPLLQYSKNLPGLLVTLDTRDIIKPDDSDFWPDQKTLRWHRKEVFVK
jgi:putative restriction endonuclease